MEDNSYQLIIDYFEKTISDDGLTQLQEWIEASPDNLAQFSETIQILEATKSYFKQTENPEKAWEKINAHVNQQESPKPAVQKRRWLAYAATCFLVCTSGWLVYKSLNSKPALTAEYEVISNADGKHTRFLLPDSSTVYLGGGSKLKYAKNFIGKTRAVYLDGEAFFDVVHLAKPFTVKSRQITTVVLGTSFNIKAYAAENKVAVTVKTGKVGVMADVRGRPQVVKYLLPNEQISINTVSGLYTFNTTDARAVNSWIDNDFIFYDTSLEEIAASMEHYYGVQIEFTEPDLGRVKLTAKFKNISLKQAMENLSALSGLAYTQKGAHVFISNNNQKGGKIMK